MRQSTNEVTQSVIADLKKNHPGSVECDVPLKHLSRWKVGGLAKVMVSPKNKEELADLRKWIYEQGLPSVVIGGTSNLLFADEGLNAIGIRIGTSFSGVEIVGNRVIADPGVWVPGLARRAMLAGLQGLEHTCGIPGTLGGLVYMNGGSQRKGIGESVEEVESIDIAGRIKKRTPDDCGFGYRISVFQSNHEVISKLTLKLQRAECKESIRRDMLKILSERRKKFPHKEPSCGSVFVSNPAMYDSYGPPGQVIEDCGLKGLAKGGALVSKDHANFIVNTGAATSSDILYLIAKVRDEVLKRTGYKMAVEARYVTSYGAIKSIDGNEMYT